jgi:5-(carboxyamino)imidazole ribonucleotide mutase
MKKQVGVIMGSSSDMDVMNEAVDFLRSVGIECEVTVVSAHRTPERMFDYARKAKKRGLKILIAGAGGAAHLPGMVASLTPLPVVGVPILSSNSIAGVDSLLSIVQMPNGIPVATVAVNAAKNAAILAMRILALSDPFISKANDGFIDSLQDKVFEQIKNDPRIDDISI